MATAAATATASAPAVDAAAAVPRRGKKKLIILIAAVLAVLLLGAGVAVYMMKQKASAEAQDGEDGASAAATQETKDEHKGPPVFVPLEPFIVNLADREVERYAQIGITLQVDDAHVADELKLYLPAVRNGILMVLAHKTSKELLERSGKEQLAVEIMREAVRPMGIHIAADEVGADGEPMPKKKKKQPAEHNPIRSVNFSSFIIQ